MDLSELTHSFDLVGSLSVERNEAGTVALKMPQQRYEKPDEKRVHQYGWGPFCKFSIDTSDYTGTAGVYLFTANYEIKYIGETADIHNRIQSGYANISPRNCFEGGQETNCRVNNAVLDVIRNGGQVALWVEQTDNRKQRESELISQCDPSWNNTTTTTAGDQSATKGKYAPLYERLENTDYTEIQFTIEEIEGLLDSPLPDSAYKHEAWWNPAGHSHAAGWVELGWSADVDLDEMSVTFENTNE